MQETRFTVPLKSWGGHHPIIVPSDVSDYLRGYAFTRRVRRLKVGQTFKFPYRLDKRVTMAVQERIYRLSLGSVRELRTITSKRTGTLFVVRAA